VEFLGIERSGLAQFSEDGKDLIVTHSYGVPGFPPNSGLNIGANLPWYSARIREGAILRFTRLPEDAPPEAIHEREYVIRHGGPRSQLTLPFKVGESILGGIGFDAFRREQDWPEGLVQSLQLVGEIFANALARKQAEMAFRASEGRFRLMADAAPVLMWISGTDKLCTYFNKPWLDFTGRPLQHEVGNGWTEGVHPDDLKRCLDTYVSAFEARQGFRMQYRLRRFDGEYRWVLDTGVPRFESDGTFEGYIGSCIDITDERHAEEESRDLRRQLARVGRVTLMGELAASIAHEVNQPLCAIVSNSQSVQRMLAGSALPMEEVREAIQDITQDAQRASEVIARIRDFLQKAPAERALVNVNDLIRQVSALLRTDMNRRGVAIKLELAERLPFVLGDRIQLQQVILNLMTNAADAMDTVARELREIVVSSSVDATATVTVGVTDTGAGLDPGNIDQVFDPFFTTKPGSLGMGLAICKSIVEAHSGRIWASANPKRGATFHFALPAIRESRS
jgi:PAS domain S-box-containing protein